MADEEEKYLVRRRNLNLIIECSPRGTSARLAEALGIMPTRISQWRAAPKIGVKRKQSPIHPRDARLIERAASLPVGWLDDPKHDSESVPELTFVQVAEARPGRSLKTVSDDSGGHSIGMTAGEVILLVSKVKDILANKKIRLSDEKFIIFFGAIHRDTVARGGQLDEKHVENMVKLFT